MALISCPECGREISDQAAACPHCGLPLSPAQQAKPAAPPKVPPYEPKKPKHYGCGTLIAAVILLVAVVSCYQAIQPTRTTPAATAPTAPPETPEERFARLVTSMSDEDGPRGRRLHAAKTIAEEFPEAAEAEAAGSLVIELEEEIRKERLGKQWRYSASEDAMTSRMSRSARVQSSNSFEFDFPYRGKQHATLVIRRHPRWGNDVIFRIERGQILCSSYGNCRVRVRFDDAQPMTLKGNPPADNSSESVFLPNYNDLVRRLRNAKVVRIEVEVYRQGTVMGEFDVEGFDPDKLQ